jgi:hypothetical protein
MTYKSRPELKDQHFDAVLTHLSEAELTQLLYHIEALRADFNRIAPLTAEPVATVTYTQRILKIWNDKVVSLLAAQQVKDSYNGLHTWDNEGGTVHHAPTRQLVSRRVAGERHMVWMALEEEPPLDDEDTVPSFPVLAPTPYNP